MSDAPSSFHDNPDFSLLEGSDEYTKYFNLLSSGYAMLQQMYTLAGSNESSEAQIVSVYLNRLLYTVEALRMKYTHMPSHQRLLWVDLSDSGFPNAQDISMVGVDLLHRDKRLRELPSAEMLKSLLLDYMFEQQDDSPELLWQLSERSYLAMLKEENLFLPFNLGDSDLRQVPSEKGKRTYLLTWGCYDFKTNRPYIHLMTFDQTPEDEPLQNKGANHLQLLELVQAEGSRVPDVGILAIAIDDALESIHPKIIKRIGIGPLYAPLLLDENTDYDDKHLAMKELMDGWAGEGDMVMTMTHEIVFSKRQEVSTSIFKANGRVREVFHLPDDDPEVFARRASVVHKHVLMPHSVAQHLSEDIVARVPELQNARVMTYDAKGNVYGR